MRRSRDGQTGRIGGDADVGWIRDGTVTTAAITAAIPAIFEAYATVELPGTRTHALSGPDQERRLGIGDRAWFFSLLGLLVGPTS